MEESETEPSRDRAWRDSLALGLIAFLAGCAVVAELHGWAGFKYSLTSGTDMAAYVDQAFGILDGTWPDPKPFYRAPLYPYALAVLIAIGRSLLTVTILQSLLFAGSCVLVMRAATIISGRAAGWLAGLMLIAYGGALYFVVVLHSTIIELFLSSLFLYLWLSWRHLPVAQTRARAARAAATGAALALLCLVRPNFLALCPVAVLMTLIEGNQRRWQSARELAWCAGLAALLLLPVVVRNNLHSDHFVVLTTNGRTTFVNSNCEDSKVFNFIYPQKPMMPIASAAFWRHQGRKAIGYWRDLEFPQNVNYYLYREQSLTLMILQLPFAVIAGLFLVGSARRRQDWRTWWPIWSMFWVYYLSIVAFFIIGRFRVPGLPPMLVVAAALLVDWREIWRSGQRRAVAGSLVAVLVLTFCMQPFHSYRTSVDYRNIGVTALGFGEAHQAELYLQHSYRLNADPQTGVLLAAALMMQGRADSALIVVQGLRKQFPLLAELMKSEATLLSWLGRDDEAVAALAGIPERIRPQIEDRLARYLELYRQTIQSNAEKYDRLL